MFWLGTAKRAAAVRKDVQSDALLSATRASAVRLGSSAVHRRATAYGEATARSGTPGAAGSRLGMPSGSSGLGSARGNGDPVGLTAGRSAIAIMLPDRSESTGPCWVERT